MIGWVVSGSLAALYFCTCGTTKKPEFQGYYVRIVFMAAIYLGVSWQIRAKLTPLTRTLHRLGYRFYQDFTYYGIVRTYTSLSFSAAS
jgi:hypothetical protein